MASYGSTDDIDVNPLVQQTNEPSQETEPSSAYFKSYAFFLPTSKLGLWLRLKKYVVETPNLALELLFCFIFHYISARSAHWILGGVNERPIPYQVTKDGADVILDLEMSHSRVDSTVNSSQLHLYFIYYPMIFFTVFGFLFGPPLDAHASLCTFLVASGTSLIITDSVKLYAGVFRPNFYDLCGFDTESLECGDLDEDGSNLWTEGRKSFPSGHSSKSFCAMTVLALYLLGKIGLQRGYIYSSPLVAASSLSSTSSVTNPSSSAILLPPPPSPLKKILAYVLTMLPMSIATFVASSRVHDNWHSPADIVTGSVIGASCAFFAYGFWYPSVYSYCAGYPLETVYRMTQQKLDSTQDSGNDVKV